jgi:hypothetical protein
MVQRVFVVLLSCLLSRGAIAAESPTANDLVGILGQSTADPDIREMLSSLIPPGQTNDAYHHVRRGLKCPNNPPKGSGCPDLNVKGGLALSPGVSVSYSGGSWSGLRLTPDGPGAPFGWTWDKLKRCKLKKLGGYRPGGWEPWWYIKEGAYHLNVDYRVQSSLQSPGDTSKDRPKAKVPQVIDIAFDPVKMGELVGVAAGAMDEWGGRSGVDLAHPMLAFLERRADEVDAAALENARRPGAELVASHGVYTRLTVDLRLLLGITPGTDVGLDLPMAALAACHCTPPDASYSRGTHQVVVSNGVMTVHSTASKQLEDRLVQQARLAASPAGVRSAAEAWGAANGNPTLPTFETLMGLPGRPSDDAELRYWLAVAPAPDLVSYVTDPPDDALSGRLVEIQIPSGAAVALPSEVDGVAEAAARSWMQGFGVMQSFTARDGHSHVLIGGLPNGLGGRVSFANGRAQALSLLTVTAGDAISEEQVRRTQAGVAAIEDEKRRLEAQYDEGAVDSQLIMPIARAAAMLRVMGRDPEGYLLDLTEELGRLRAEGPPTPVAAANERDVASTFDRRNERDCDGRVAYYIAWTADVADRPTNGTMQCATGELAWRYAAGVATYRGHTFTLAALEVLREMGFAKRVYMIAYEDAQRR